jgi:predicted metal-dependent HD superfamily phosphohydrolase
MSLQEQWIATWEELGAATPLGVFEEVLARYGEPQRHYHTARHLEECFAELAAVRGEAERPGEVELALWFHDAVYDTKRHDNEERSAEWARSVVAQAGLDACVGERVGALIMATRHAAEPDNADARVLVDVDLSILGAEPVRFDEYERAVREEYRWVPEAVFRRTRRKILQGFLERPHLFTTARMREMHERRARANLERSLVQLRPNLRLAADVGALCFGIALMFGLAAGFAARVEAAAAAAALWWLLYYTAIRPRMRRAPPLAAVARTPPAESRYAVTCDDEGVAVTFDGKLVESARWADVTAVLIRIDDGFLPQPWWIVKSANGGCTYPNDARGAEAAIDALASRLRGFDYPAVIKAMGLMSGGVIVWEDSRRP